VLVTLAPLRIEQRDAFPAMAGVAQGLYTMARARRTLGAPRRVRSTGCERLPCSVSACQATSIRRPAWLALIANGTVDRRDVSGAENRAQVDAGRGGAA
jgi:hypothetical protein